jgi:hypothetical protein
LTSTSGALGSALALLAVPMALLLAQWVGDAETILHVWLLLESRRPRPIG